MDIENPVVTYFAFNEYRFPEKSKTKSKQYGPTTVSDSNKQTHHRQPGVPY